MSPRVYAVFSRILRDFYKESSPRKVLEIGASRKTLLSISLFERSFKVGLNLEFKKISPELGGCHLVIGNSNKMVFRDDAFDCILSSSVLEHDRYFWRTIDEIRRVLMPGGLLVIGVPVYMRLPTDFRHTTLTFARHGYKYDADYYRFSEQAVREVLFESFDPHPPVLVRRYPNPFLVMSGVKRASIPGFPLSPVNP